MLLYINFTKAFDSIHRDKMAEILDSYGIPERTIKAIMMLYKNTGSMDRSPDWDTGDTDIFDVVAGVLQGDNLAPYLFIICLDYVLRVAVDFQPNLGLKLSKSRSSRYPAKYLTDVDHADDHTLPGT